MHLTLVNAVDQGQISQADMRFMRNCVPLHGSRRRSIQVGVNCSQAFAESLALSGGAFFVWYHGVHFVVLQLVQLLRQLLRGSCTGVPIGKR